MIFVLNIIISIDFMKI